MRSSLRGPRLAITLCAGAWAVLLTSYVMLALTSHEPLPPPYNVLIFILVATVTAVVVAWWHVDHVNRRLDAVAEAATRAATLVEEVDERVDRRDGRLFFAITSTGKELALLRMAIEEFPTIELSRRPVAVGYDAGYADGLARRPMRDAKVIPLEPRESGS